jgi:hypothetical protein
MAIAIALGFLGGPRYIGTPGLPIPPPPGPQPGPPGSFSSAYSPAFDV